MAKFKVKALAVVEFDVDFPDGVTAAQARTRLVDDAHWSHRKSVGFVDDLIRIEGVDLISTVPAMPTPVKSR